VSKLMPKFDLGRLVRTLGVCICAVLVTDAFASEHLTAREIMDEVASRHDVDYEKGIEKMTLIDRSGNENIRILRRYVGRQDDRLFKYLLVFDSPKGIKGVAALTWENKSGNDDQWLFMPAAGNKLKRIASGGRRDYFMGTDFSFEDLVSEQRDNFTYEILEETNWEGIPSYVIQASPINKDIVTAYKKRHLIIRKDIYFVVQVDYFEQRSGKLLKRLVSDNLEQIKGSMWRANRSVMDNLKKKSQTRLETMERLFGSDSVPGKVFTKRYLTSKRHMKDS
jgi:hypothetical protein